MLVDKVNGLKAHAIPALLKDGLHLDLSTTEAGRFHGIREKRNEIAHGKEVNLTLRKFMKMHADLHMLAVKVDKHLLEHYFIIEKFLP